MFEEWREHRCGHGKAHVSPGNKFGLSCLFPLALCGWRICPAGRAQAPCRPGPDLRGTPASAVQRLWKEEGLKRNIKGNKTPLLTVHVLVADSLHNEEEVGLYTVYHTTLETQQNLPGL